MEILHNSNNKSVIIFKGTLVCDLCFYWLKSGSLSSVLLWIHLLIIYL